MRVQYPKHIVSRNCQSHSIFALRILHLRILAATWISVNHPANIMSMVFCITRKSCDPSTFHIKTRLNRKNCLQFHYLLWRSLCNTSNMWYWLIHSGTFFELKPTSCWHIFRKSLVFNGKPSDRNRISIKSTQRKTYAGAIIVQLNYTKTVGVCHCW